MSEKRFTIVGKEYLGYTQGYAYIIRDNSIVCEPHQWRQWSVWEDKEDVEDLCDLLNEQQDTITKQKEEISNVLNDYSRQFKRHSKEFSFMLDLAEDLGVKRLEAKDD